MVNAGNLEWILYLSGIFSCSSATCSDDEDSLSAFVLLVGYGTDPLNNQEYFILKNSQGTSWGYDGYMLIEN